jgi:hypothetical protein
MSSRKKRDRQKQMRRGRGPRLRFGTREIPGIGPVDVVRLPTAEKMSRVILDFLGPYLEQTHSDADIEKLVTVGIVAWNTANVAGKEREKLLEATLEKFPADARQSARALIEELVRRKEALFADNKRMILDYELTETPSGRGHLSVVSTFGAE